MGKLSLGAAALEPSVLPPSLPSCWRMALMDSSHSLVRPRKKCVRVFMAIAESTISAFIAAT